MADNHKTGKTYISHSVPCSPVARNVVKSEFLLKTLIPKENIWVQGVPMPVVQGLMNRLSLCWLALPVAMLLWMGIPLNISPPFPRN